MKQIDAYTTFHDLAKDRGLIIQPARLDKWRLTYPNAGELEGFPHLGTVLIMATDGVEAYFHVGRDEMFHGHLAAFTGPVAKVYVWECDWDYVNHKRKVSVFKRRDGSVVIIPRNKDMEEYKTIHIASWFPIGTLVDDEGFSAPPVRGLTGPSLKARKEALLATI